jgi:hypothetical protein
MRGKVLQGKFVCGCSLDERISEDHLLRSVAKAVDFSFVRDLVRHTYSDTGAASVDPGHPLEPPARRRLWRGEGFVPKPASRCRHGRRQCHGDRLTR